MNKPIEELIQRLKEPDYKCYGCELSRGEAELAISALEQQLNNGWIPVSERLPKEGRYLVTTVYGEVKESEFDLKKWWQIDNSTISLEWEEEPIKVVAWQPLPEPYKEVSE